jgi:hypothetical protein
MRSPICIQKRRSSVPYLEAEERTMPTELRKRDGWHNKNRKNMSDTEDSIEKALHPALEQVYQRDFPNPNREGCPGHSFLEKAATSPGSLDNEETALFLGHVLSKCWPCFKELKELRETQQARKHPGE